MDQEFSADLIADPERVFPIVADLGRYHQFLDIVHKVEPDPTPTDDGRNAWFVTLRAKVGPFSRSKRLRMVETARHAPTLIRFERAELDGRDHSSWVLEARLAPSGAGSVLTMVLAYSGGLWSSALDGLLRGQVERAAVRLDDLAATG